MRQVNPYAHLKSPELDTLFIEVCHGLILRISLLNEGISYLTLPGNRRHFEDS